MDLTMTRGDTPTWTITIKRQGSVVDLTGATIKFTARKTVDSPDVFFQKSTTGGGITISSPAANGICVLALDAADTNSLPISKDTTLLVDLEVTESDGYKSTTLGTLLVQVDITR